MKKAIVGLIICCVMLMCYFGFQNYYDYSYDTTSPILDLEECSEINSNMIERSFSNVILYAKNIVDTINLSILIRSGDNYTLQLSSESKAFLETLNNNGKNYIDNNKPWIIRNHWYGKLKLVNDLFIMPGVYKQLIKDVEITIYNEWFGWSNNDILQLHNIMVTLEISHKYNNETYYYEDFTHIGGGGTF